ncbi:MAG: hypothetical protein HOG25_15100 [Gammaproteobacteria bacterium]|nr:hypothetical protein [Gammaproteobacteria bacterium]
MDAEKTVETSVAPEPTNLEGPLNVAQAQEQILNLLDAGEAQPEAVEDLPTEETESQPIEDEDVSDDEAGEDEPESEEDEEEYDPDTDNVAIEGEDVSDTYSVRVDGQDVEVTLDELQAGYSRQSDYTKKTQEIADERKGLEQYQTQFNEQYQLLTQERQQYQQALSQLGNHLSEGINRFSTVDWAKLKEEDPIAYVTKRDEFREEKERIQQVSNQQNQISQQQATEVEQARRHSVIQESTRLKELIPEWSDPVKQPELAGKIKSYGSSQGYSDQELNNLIDSRSVNVLMKAMKYDALQQADLKTKKIKNKPKMVKPGTKRTKVDAATRRKAKSMKQLQQSGSAVDAGRLLEDIL